jgi:hypothetical protein
MKPLSLQGRGRGLAEGWEGEGTLLSPAFARFLPSPSYRFAAGPSLSPKGRGERIYR